MIPSEIRSLLWMAGSLLALLLAVVWREAHGGRIRAVVTQIDQAHELRFQLVSIAVELDRSLLAKRGYVLTGETSQLENFQKHRRDSWARLQEVRSRTQDHPELQHLLDDLMRLFQDQDRVSDAVVAGYQQGGPSAVRELLNQSHDPVRHAEITALLERCQALQDEILADRREEMMAKQQLRVAITAIVALLAVAAFTISVVNIWHQLRARRLRLAEVERENATLEQRVNERTKALEEALERLSEAQSIARLGHWYLDLASSTGTWSPYMFTLVGRDPRDGTPGLGWFLDRIHPEDRPQVIQLHETAIATGQPFTHRYRLRGADDAWRWVETRARPKLRPDGSWVAMEGTLQDVHDLAMVEQRLRESNTILEGRVAERTRDLEEKNRQLEAFTYSVSHDLKAPLRGIDGYSRLLELDKSAQLDDEGRQFIATIRTATKQMGQLVDDLLSYSRLERRAQRRTSVHVDALVQDTIHALQRDPHHAKVVFSTDLTPVQVMTDPESLSIVLRNLLDNAVKFSLERPSPHVSVTMAVSADQVELQVQDNGIGFDDAYRDRIFEIFQRLNPSERYPGTGVGLALVRKAVDLLGGTCEAHGVVQQGALFTVRIPR